MKACLIVSLGMTVCISPPKWPEVVKMLAPSSIFSLPSNLHARDKSQTPTVRPNTRCRLVGRVPAIIGNDLRVQNGTSGKRSSKIVDLERDNYPCHRSTNLESRDQRRAGFASCIRKGLAWRWCNAWASSTAWKQKHPIVLLHVYA